MFVLLLFLLLGNNVVNALRRRQAVDADADAAATTGVHTVTRRWHEFMLFATHEASADPPVQARDLFHFSAVLFDTWRVFNQRSGAVANSIFVDEPVQMMPTQAAVDAATDEAINFAAYAFTMNRFKDQRNEVPIFQSARDLFEQLGYDVAKIGITSGSSPAAIGTRIGTQTDARLRDDGSCQASRYYCDEYKYYNTSNPYIMSPFWIGAGAVLDPNKWQRFEFGTYVDKTDMLVDGYPPFANPQWAWVQPFALSDADKALDAYGNPLTDYDANAQWDGTYFDPGPPPVLDIDSPTKKQYQENFTAVIKCGAYINLDGVMWSISPGNNTLGANNHFLGVQGFDSGPLPCGNVGIGHEVNPYTQQPYAPVEALRGDYTRVLGYFWEDRPESDTPQRHWNWITNKVLDMPQMQFKWGGVGKPVSRTEFEVKTYLSVNAAMHDAAITAWGCKRKYDFVRPITAIRYMGMLGQSSDPTQADYHPLGLPLVDGYTRVIKAEDICIGRCGTWTNNVTAFQPGPFYTLGFTAINRTALLSYDPTSRGFRGAGWLLADDWHPYRRPSYVTPPFPGYISGHSIFARAAADMLTRLTGDQFFPGGLWQLTAVRNQFLRFDMGPSRDVSVQWATYGDMADASAISRVYVGVHAPADELVARQMGRMVGDRVWSRLTTQVFGSVSGARIGVRVEFAASIASTFGSEAACAQWAQALALPAHALATQTDTSYDATLAFRLVPRMAGDPINSRTVMLIGANPNAGPALLSALQSDARVTRATLLQCDQLQCVAGDTPTPFNPWYVIIPIVALITAGIVVGVYVTQIRRRDIRALAR